MIAYCGLKCNECLAFIATAENDNKKRQEIAELWSKEYNAQLSAEDINCTGCLSEGDGHFSNCLVCEIRKCAMEKNAKNCAACENYICEKLNLFFNMVPEAKITLDSLHDQ